MTEQKLGSLVARERRRLAKKRTELTTRRAEIDAELGAIDRELAAAEAYEQALGRKAAGARVTRKKRATTKKKAAARAGAGRPRRGSRREAIVAVIAKQDTGASRGEILTAMGVKGNKSAEQAISNALTAMKKSGRISARDGKYFA